MSIVTTAIIAGASAGLSGVAKTAIEDLYNGLKSLIMAKERDIDFAKLESNPADEVEQKSFSNSVKDYGLEDDPLIVSAAERLIQKIVSEKVPLNKGALISIKELSAREGIVLEDIDLDSRLLEAEVAETDGQFRAVSYTHLTLPTNREV